MVNDDLFKTLQTLHEHAMTCHAMLVQLSEFQQQCKGELVDDREAFLACVVDAVRELKRSVEWMSKHREQLYAFEMYSKESEWPIGLREDSDYILWATTPELCRQF